MCASKQKVSTMNQNNPMSYSQLNKWHKKTDIFLKVQSVGYIRDRLKAPQLHKRQKGLCKGLEEITLTGERRQAKINKKNLSYRA